MPQVSNGNKANADCNDVNAAYTSRFQSDFELLERLGFGGYGVVFKVKRKSDGVEYAIKRVDLTHQPKEVMERERKIKDCVHPNIVRYFDSWLERPPPKWQEKEDEKWMKSLDLCPIVLGWHLIDSSDASEESKHIEPMTIPSPKHPAYLYIQMELCREDNLADWLHHSNVNRRKNKYLSIFAETVEAVKYIHSRELIHRDLKPENIMFGLDGHIKIGDFGTVTLGHDSRNLRHRGKKSHVLPEHTEGIGTKWYKAPELNGTHYDNSVDIFSLGVILYELISPFTTDSERFEAIDRLRNSPFPKMFDPRFKNEFDLLKRMLSMNRKKRPTIATIQEHLSRWGIDRWEPDRSNILDFFDTISMLFAIISTPKPEKHDPTRDGKIVSKKCPTKIKKDHRILQ